MARMNAIADIAKAIKANIHAVDNLSPVSRVAVYVRAGSRYEPDDVPGISHFVRASSGLTTQDSSIFGITRHLERAGATFKVTSDREFIIYRINCLRDKLGYVLGFIDDTIHKPEFRSWELVDVVQPRLKEDLSRYKSNQLLMANEAMHKAAYRGGLAHSVFIPEHQITKVKRDHCMEYVSKNFVLERMSFTGLGTNPNEIKIIIDEQFELNENKYNGVDGFTRYVGGEARIQAGFSKTLMNYVVQGSSFNDMKKVAALQVIGSMLGGEQQTYVRYGDGPEKSLSQILTKQAPGTKCSIININHSDTGLFGFSLLGPNETMKEATKRAVKHVKKVMEGVSEEDLKMAKRNVKARALIQSEDPEAVFESMSRHHANGIVGTNSIDHVDKLTLKDVQGVAGQIMKSKPTMVSVGNPRYVPYIDELD